MLRNLKISCFVCLLPTLAAAGDDLRVDTVDVRLREVVVTDRSRHQVVEPQCLDAATLQRLNSQSVADAVRHLSGVQVKDYGGVGGIKTINIRGMGSQHVGVMLDGLAIDNAQNGQVDLGRLSLDNVDRIELYNGNRSSIFQSAREFASGSSVYIYTRHPRFEGDTRSHLRVRVLGGSFGLINPEVLAEVKMTPQVSLSASVGYQYANGKYKFHVSRHLPDGTVLYDTTATRTGGHVSALRTDINLFGVTSRGTYTAKVYYYDSSRGIPGAIVNNVFGTRERQSDRSAIVQSSGQWTLNDRYMLRFAAKWGWDYTHFVRDDERMPKLDNTYYQRQWYGSVTHLYRITRRWDVSLATDLGWSTMGSDMARFAYPRRLTSLAALSTALTVGPVDMQGSMLLNHIADNAIAYTTGERSDSHITRWTPSAYVSWQPLPGVGWKLSAFAKRSFRMPTFNELYFTDVGNRALRPESSTQYNLGSAITLPLHRAWCRQVEVEVNAYHNRVRDKIVAYPSGQQFRWTMLNLGKVDIWGTEVTASLSGRVGEVDCDLRGTYTYERAIDVSDPSASYYRDQIPYIPHHSCSFAAMPSWRGWELNAALVYTGQRWSNRENIPANNLDAWLTIDASLRRDFALWGADWRASVEVNNLTDRHYQVIRNYPMPGRSYRVSVEVRM